MTSPERHMRALIGKPFRFWRNSTRARAYTLRVLICWNIIICAVALAGPDHPDLAFGSMTVVHHIYLPFASPDFFTFDLVLLTVETIWSFVSMFLSGIFAIFAAMNFIMLGAFIFARVAGSPWRGKSLDFFGGCDLVQPQYTAMETLFGRPASRALVRMTSGGKLASMLGKPLRSWCASTPARAYTFRALLCWNIIISAVASLGLTSLPYLDLPFGLTTVVHHIYVPFASPRFFTFDLVLLTLQTICVCFDVLLNIAISSGELYHAQCLHLFSLCWHFSAGENC
ncbi:hypothetical protein B0H14DRAFT_3019315 [Mycena olivaceomarginata]|nr:hypothetical protein B0H14DRAFT_3019315 [Mycena olivaceomarginata]